MRGVIIISMTKITVCLSGKEYTIQTDESVEHVKRLAEELDAKITDFMGQNDSITVTSACMLVALGLMDDCLQASGEKENLRNQVVEYLEEATKCRAITSDLENKISSLEKQIKSLEEEKQLMGVKLMAHGEKGFSDD